MRLVAPFTCFMLMHIAIRMFWMEEIASLIDSTRAGELSLLVSLSSASLKSIANSARPQPQLDVGALQVFCAAPQRGRNKLLLERVCPWCIFCSLMHSVNQKSHVRSAGPAPRPELCNFLALLHKLLLERVELAPPALRKRLRQQAAEVG